MASKSQASSSKSPFSNTPPKPTPQAAPSSSSFATAREKELIRESVEYELKRLELYKRLEYSNTAEVVATLRSDSLARIQELETIFSKLEKAKASAHDSQPSTNLEQPDNSEEDIDSRTFHLPSASPTGYEYHILSPITSDSDGIHEPVQFQFCHVPLSEEMIPAMLNHFSLFNMVESQLLIINQLIAERNAETLEFGQWVLAGFNGNNGSAAFGVVLKFCGHSETCFQRLRPRPKINLFNQLPGSNLSRNPAEQPTNANVFAGSPGGSKVFREPKNLFNQPPSSDLSRNPDATKQPTSTSAGSLGGSRVSGYPSGISSEPLSGGLFGGTTELPTGTSDGSSGRSGVFGEGSSLFSFLGSPTKQPASVFDRSPGERRVSSEPRKEGGDSPRQPTSRERSNGFGKMAVHGDAREEKKGTGKPCLR